MMAFWEKFLTAMMGLFGVPSNQNFMAPYFGPRGEVGSLLDSSEETLELAAGGHHSKGSHHHPLVTITTTTSAVSTTTTTLSTHPPTHMSKDEVREESSTLKLSCHILEPKCLQACILVEQEECQDVPVDRKNAEEVPPATKDHEGSQAKSTSQSTEQNHLGAEAQLYREQRRSKALWKH
ncbi:hypothetical protein GWK47_012846 [Chionoecetes opilio]|uniref:Uncharacterized protein n=1 Tax=Chionoecetes opilio TaxID=41210 RepID=A0A8J5CLQ7_CHIOP|nr:hypothetical protein GWK47_012846 [Chionoecetes opilio]